MFLFLRLVPCFEALVLFCFHRCIRVYIRLTLLPVFGQWSMMHLGCDVLMGCYNGCLGLFMVELS